MQPTLPAGTAISTTHHGTRRRLALIVTMILTVLMTGVVGVAASPAASAGQPTEGHDSILQRDGAATSALPSGGCSFFLTRNSTRIDDDVRVTFGGRISCNGFPVSISGSASLWNYVSGDFIETGNLILNRVAWSASSIGTAVVGATHPPMYIEFRLRLIAWPGVTWTGCAPRNSQGFPLFCDGVGTGTLRVLVLHDPPFNP